LAERHQVNERMLIQPFSSLHKLVMKIAQMGDGTAKRCEPKVEKNEKQFKNFHVCVAAALKSLVPPNIRETAVRQFP
jgi:hypothetical protein